MDGIDDYALQPRRVKQPFLLVEIPAARLLRHQPPLQPIGALGDGALEMNELLVQIRAQPPQFLFVAKLGCFPDLAEAVGEYPTVDVRWQLGERRIRAGRKHAIQSVFESGRASCREHGREDVTRSGG